MFLDLTQVTATHHASSLPPIILLHHLFVRGHPQLKLPMNLWNWTEDKYSSWLDEHEDSEAYALLAKCADIYAEEVTRKGEKEFCVEYPSIKSVLANIVGK